MKIKDFNVSSLTNYTRKISILFIQILHRDLYLRLHEGARGRTSSITSPYVYVRVSSLPPLWVPPETYLDRTEVPCFVLPLLARSVHTPACPKLQCHSSESKFYRNLRCWTISLRFEVSLGKMK